ncbi:MAG: GNAT family N-acetyltransferase [Lachnospiraceae bacterium]|jgi:GNAT superfamily N-acetyltransferase|nr:GNAT family N-acetyltransferase [Lachnospiraceae bacterium]
MPIIIQSPLSPQRLKQVQDLTAQCLTAFPAPLSCPEDGDIYFLMEEVPKTNQEPVLAAFLALYILEDKLFECSAFTRPDRRQKGLFSALLEAAEAAYPDHQFSFPVPEGEACLPALSALDSLGAEFWYREHLMALDAEHILSSAFPSFPAAAPFSLQIAEKDGIKTAKAFYNQILTASCSLDIAQFSEGNICCLHQVLVPEELRGKGWGTRFLLSLLPALTEQGICRFLLQVSGENLPAIALYKKAGFQITETLSYYLY